MRGSPGGCFVVGEREIEGYLLTRPGANAWHIGPMVARDPEVAERLVRTALHTHAGEPALMDVVMENQDAVTLSERLGLAPVRPFIRNDARPSPDPRPGTALHLGRPGVRASKDLN